MKRKNIPNKVAKKQKDRTWDKKLASLRKQYGGKVSKSQVKRAQQYAKRAGVSFHNALSDLLTVNGKKEDTQPTPLSLYPQHSSVVAGRLRAGWMMNEK